MHIERYLKHSRRVRGAMQGDVVERLHELPYSPETSAPPPTSPDLRARGSGRREGTAGSPCGEPEPHVITTAGGGPAGVNGAQRARRQTRTHYRVADVRALLRNREFIKVTAFVLPTPTKRQVLDMMERLRRERMTDRSGQPLVEPAEPLPEMTDGEMVREINWRVSTLPPQDAETLAGYVRRLTQWRAKRRSKASASGEIPARSPD